MSSIRFKLNGKFLVRNCEDCSWGDGKSVEFTWWCTGQLINGSDGSTGSWAVNHKLTLLTHFVWVPNGSKSANDCKFWKLIHLTEFPKIRKKSKKSKDFFWGFKVVYLIWEWTTINNEISNSIRLNPFLFIKSSYTKKRNRKNPKISGKI